MVVLAFCHNVKIKLLLFSEEQRNFFFQYLIPVWWICQYRSLVWWIFQWWIPVMNFPMLNSCMDLSVLKWNCDEFANAEVFVFFIFAFTFSNAEVLPVWWICQHRSLVWWICQCWIPVWHLVLFIYLFRSYINGHTVRGMSRSLFGKTLRNICLWWVSKHCKYFEENNSEVLMKKIYIELSTQFATEIFSNH
jgi:hypothetical protein